MDRSDLQENLLSLYLRLNGYFVTGFIVHASLGNRTEMDALAVRFPHHREPEREVDPSPVLHTSDSLLDFLVCEVKSGTRALNFNAAFREDPQAITSVLHRFGAFPDKEIPNLVREIQTVLRPEYIRRSQTSPTVNLPRLNSRLRLVLVAPDQKRSANNLKPYIYGDDMILYIWECFRPKAPRQRCGVRYSWHLWGEQYRTLVEYFKDDARREPGDIDSLYENFGRPVTKAARTLGAPKPRGQIDVL